MNINLEKSELHSVQAYSDNNIKINSIIYESSVILSKEKIITDIAINDITQLDDYYINLLLNLKPEIIIVGHLGSAKQIPKHILSQLADHQIGIEFMSIGAACRTYNVLLNEYRAVVAGFIF